MRLPPVLVALAALVALVLGKAAARAAASPGKPAPVSRWQAQKPAASRATVSSWQAQPPAAWRSAIDELAGIDRAALFGLSKAPNRAARRGGLTAALTTTSVLVFTLFVGLASVGVVHGLWTKDLTVSGVAVTGDLNADWTRIQTLDRCNQASTAEVAVLSNGVTSQTTSSSDDGYGDQDGGIDNPCPSDPCPDSGAEKTASTSGGSEDPCPPDSCSDSGIGIAPGTFGGSEDPCTLDPCPDGGTGIVPGTDGGSENPCTVDPCSDPETSATSSEPSAETSGGTDSSGGDSADNLCAPSCDVMIGGVDADGPFGNQVAYLDISNATPGYWCEVKAWVRNTGSVPFNIIGVSGVLDDANDKGLSFEDLNGSEPGVCKLVDEQGNDSAERQVDPDAAAIIYCKVVIDQSTKTCGAWLNGTCKVWTYTLGAEYGWSYHFAVDVCVAQWNEDPSPGGPDDDFRACKYPSSGTHEGPETPALPTPGPTP